MEYTTENTYLQIVILAIVIVFIELSIDLFDKAWNCSMNSMQLNISAYGSKPSFFGWEGCHFLTNFLYLCNTSPE